MFGMVFGSGSSNILYDNHKLHDFIADFYADRLSKVRKTLRRQDGSVLKHNLQVAVKVDGDLREGRANIVIQCFYDNSLVFDFVLSKEISQDWRIARVHPADYAMREEFQAFSPLAHAVEQYELLSKDLLVALNKKGFPDLAPVFMRTQQQIIGQLHARNNFKFREEMLSRFFRDTIAQIMEDKKRILIGHAFYSELEGRLQEDSRNFIIEPFTLGTPNKGGIQHAIDIYHQYPREKTSFLRQFGLKDKKTKVARIIFHFDHDEHDIPQIHAQIEFAKLLTNNLAFQFSLEHWLDTEVLTAIHNHKHEELGLQTQVTAKEGRVVKFRNVEPGQYRMAG